MKTFQKILLAGGLLTFATALAAPPAWWATRGVTNGNTASDFAVANIGQVKNIATQAAAEMNADLPGGAGVAINTLVASWSPPSGTAKDYAAINQGQLKTIAKLFYDQLAAAGYHGTPLTSGQTYPWDNSSNAASSYAVANIGQVKFLFSFDLQLTLTSVDSNQNGIPDSWEIYYFGRLLNPGEANTSAPDGSGFTNLQEYQMGRNPGSITDDQAFTPGSSDVVMRTPSGQYYDVNTSTWVISTVASP